jgi:hypothetical protein
VLIFGLPLENLAAGTGSGYSIQVAIKSWTDEVCTYISVPLSKPVLGR